MSARLLATAALALGWLVTACNAPPPQAIAGTGSDALSDSDYRSLSADPATGQRDWIPAKPSGRREGGAGPCPLRAGRPVAR
ncbi:hypothetical protein BH11MYX4_BH11MYX4_63200 [soil metagenome]